MRSSFTTGGALAKAAATSAQVSSRARRRRNEDKVGHEAVTGQVSADDRRVGAPPRRELAIAVALAGLGALGLGMAQQQQTTHRGNVAFSGRQSSAVDLKFL